MSIRTVTQAILRARESITSQRAALETSELRTRTVLIDPVLGALGWDVSDPTVVRIELGVNGGFADYALLDPETEKPAIILEAKKLGVDKLVPVESQIASYSGGDGSSARLVTITNGNLWRVYENAAGPMIGSNLMAVSVTGHTVAECAKELARVLSPRHKRRRMSHAVSSRRGERNPQRDSLTGGIPTTPPLLGGAYGPLFPRGAIDPNE